jgi:hypothetical protein
MSASDLAPIDTMTEVLIRLAKAGLPTDMIELLVQGNPAIGVPPNTLSRALAPALRHQSSEGSSSIDYWQRQGHQPTAFERMAIAGKQAVQANQDGRSLAGEVYDAVLAAAPLPVSPTPSEGDKP